MAEIVLDNVSKRFPGGTLALRDASFTIRDGELFIVVGPSGCGKTSLLRMIAGHEEISSGAVLIDGHDVSVLAPAARPTSMMFQNYALFPHLTVLDNVAFALKIKGLGKAERHDQAFTMLQNVQLRDLAGRYRTSCRAASSSGWRSRARSSHSQKYCFLTSRCP